MPQTPANPKPIKQYKIESGVPLPLDVRKQENTPWHGMKIGESIGGVPIGTAAGWQARAKTLGFELTIRRTPDGTCRIWRVK